MVRLSHAENSQTDGGSRPNSDAAAAWVLFGLILSIPRAIGPTDRLLLVPGGELGLLADFLWRRHPDRVYHSRTEFLLGQGREALRAPLAGFRLSESLLDTHGQWQSRQVGLGRHLGPQVPARIDLGSWVLVATLRVAWRELLIAGEGLACVSILGRVPSPVVVPRF